jgi:catechol 2,3-dioxygenase-like lactoylglutathione lyase family enzyme
VTAFKFQDPDGHPLELLAFPEDGVPPHWRERLSTGIFLGIDHSAISVRETAASTAFYQSLGFTVIAKTFNHGVEQAHLDGIPNPQVEVTALALDASTPHLELLCYQSKVHPPRQALASNDVAATRIVLAADGLDAKSEANANSDADANVCANVNGEVEVKVKAKAMENSYANVEVNARANPKAASDSHANVDAKTEIETEQRLLIDPDGHHLLLIV